MYSIQDVFSTGNMREMDNFCGVGPKPGVKSHVFSKCTPVLAMVLGVGEGD